MTIQESQSLIGRAARYDVRGLGFDVVILAIRNGFGRTDLQIKPAQGTGETWVSSQSVKLLLPWGTNHSWPRNKTKSVETRSKDLVIRITNWLKDKDEPAYDVECYIAGVYDWNESKSFCLSSGLTDGEARLSAIEYAQRQVAKHINAI